MEGSSVGVQIKACCTGIHSDVGHSITAEWEIRRKFLPVPLSIYVGIQYKALYSMCNVWISLFTDTLPLPSWCTTGWPFVLFLWVAWSLVHVHPSYLCETQNQWLTLRYVYLLGTTTSLIDTTLIKSGWPITFLIDMPLHGTPRWQQSHDLIIRSDVGCSGSICMRSCRILLAYIWTISWIYVQADVRTVV